MAQDQMMNDRKHENQVESAGEAVKQREVFAIAPSGRGSGTGDVRNQSSDGFVLFGSGAPEYFKSG